MVRLLALLLLGCRPEIRTTTISIADARARIDSRCSVLTGLRRATCVRLGPPRAPAREHWATASWWLYETRYWEQVAGSVRAIGPQVICASYVAFTDEGVLESDEQCHRVTQYVP